ncbi:MAG: DUF1549 domain-containing protein [Polyangiales bacterium]
MSASLRASKASVLRRSFALVAALATIAASPRAEGSTKKLVEYRHFRALSIDLLGRMPTREEIAAFEADNFDMDAWIDRHLEGPRYSERLTRLWLDVLRLELSPSALVQPIGMRLVRSKLQAPDGKPLYVYFRGRQRRPRDATDGEFCMTKDETGVDVLENGGQYGTPKSIAQNVLDANTVVVKPWWLWHDYRSAAPTEHLGTTWKDVDPGWSPTKDMLRDANGQPAVTIRVCKEEAQTAVTGHVGFANRAKGPLPAGRIRPFPQEDAWAKVHVGEAIACNTGTASTVANECGCGVGLERCLPPEGIDTPYRVDLGVDEPVDVRIQLADRWMALWFSQEASQYIHRIFRDDTDVREMLTGKWTVVNGPLAQLYGADAEPRVGAFGQYGIMEDGEPLFDASSTPKELLPHDVSRWERVASRGPHAAGLLTMPVFLLKYASRRARAAATYSGFLCRQFVAADVTLTASTEPDLAKRPGCSSCHASLEPLAAYFTRTSELGWRWLPESVLPLENSKCGLQPGGILPQFCRVEYDPAFSTTAHGVLRGAHASFDHANAGPAGLAAAVVDDPGFASCVVERVASGFLGRPVANGDAALLAELRATFVKEGFRARPLVRALVRSKAYGEANDLPSDAWRAEAP